MSRMAAAKAKLPSSWQRESLFYYIINSFTLIFHLFSAFFYFLLVSILRLIVGRSKKNVFNQVALVTGGGRGLGREIAIQLATAGCKIAILGRNLDAGQETVEEIENNGKKDQAKAYKVDVSDFEAIKNIINVIETELGPVDILVNNAGLMPIGAIDKMTKDEVEKTIATVGLLLPGMIQRKRGHIVAISSIAGVSAIPVATCYSATKFGINGFMDSLRLEMLRRHHDFIHTTTAFPYFIATNDQLRRYLEDNRTLKYLPAMSAQIVAKRIVDGVLKNEKKIYIPNLVKNAINLTRIAPLDFQDYAKTYWAKVKRQQAAKSLKFSSGLE